MAEQRDPVVDAPERERPDGRGEGEEDGGEQEPIAEERQRVAPAERVLGLDEVERVRDGAAERRGDADAVERDAVPRVDDH